MHKKNMSKNIIKSLIFYALLVVCWQLIYWLGTEVLEWWKPYAFPNPTGVVSVMFKLFKDGTILLAIIYSLKRALIGFFIAVFIGMLLAVLIYKVRMISRYLKPILMGMQTLPSICWVPFAILWFGLNEEAIIFVVIMGAAFGIALSLESGMKNINSIYVKVARTMGANEKDLFFKVIFPASMPALIAGLRQGWSFAWRALMSGEVMSSTIGLGYTLMMGRDLADINQVMFVMLVIVAVGIFIDKCIFLKAEEKIMLKRGIQI